MSSIPTSSQDSKTRTADTPLLGGVFPGQGAQSIGMLNALAQAYPMVRETFGEASDSLSFDLWSLVTDGPESELNRTQNTQPVMLAAGVSVWRVWQAVGGKAPVIMAGHSFGEYTALVCAGVLDFRAAVTLVRERGLLMQAAVKDRDGAMAAVLGLEDAQVADICAQAAKDLIVAPVNFNAPGQVVIAGDSAAVLRAMSLATEAGAKRVLRLAVSVPAHCTLMMPAAEALAPRLAEVPLRTPGIPVLHNVDVLHHEDADTIRVVLARQLYSPVRWAETIKSFAALGVNCVLEFGPGKVLTGLNKRIDKSLRCACIYDPQSLERALELTINGTACAS
ncbi:MAG: ACP S-malonyltransferase [Gammaproteobacteria bacterium]|nr:ACP S-malonyltransferase [Gammaproteobacteria bacterium]